MRSNSVACAQVQAWRVSKQCCVCSKAPLQASAGSSACTDLWVQQGDEGALEQLVACKECRAATRSGGSGSDAEQGWRWRARRRACSMHTVCHAAALHKTRTIERKILQKRKAVHASTTRSRGVRQGQAGSCMPHSTALQLHQARQRSAALHQATRSRWQPTPCTSRPGAASSWQTR